MLVSTNQTFNQKVCGLMKTKKLTTCQQSMQSITYLLDEKKNRTGLTFYLDWLNIRKWIASVVTETFLTTAIFRQKLGTDSKILQL